ncbi:META domain-containing protein [Streptomyces sp. NPDC088116]|uniref:META domain-containing protein n=1 Tax=Streptomyces sp. NPDC088116 TaxID=3365825 RepID=UPI0038119CC8
MDMPKQRITLITKVTSVTTVALLTLAACGTESGTGGAAGADSGSGKVKGELPLTDVRWHVDSVTVGGKKTAAPTGASVEIDSKGQASARTGCNSLGAKVTVDGDTITVGEKSTTEMGCAKDLQSFEKALSGAFSGKLKAKLADKRLTLTTADGDAIALTSEAPAPLTGTEWTVDALTEDSTATALPKGTDGKARFTFSKDEKVAGKETGKGSDKATTEGSVKGNLGCNSFSAPAKISGSTVTFGRVTSTRKLCPGPEMTVERQVQKVLEGKVTYELHHRTLTLKAADGQGLSAAAAPSGK